MKSVNRVNGKTVTIFTQLFVFVLVFGVDIATAQISTDNKTDPKNGANYSEIIAQYQTGTGDALKEVRLATTLDTGAGCVLVKQNLYQKIGSGDSIKATVQIASFAAFTNKFKKDNNPVNDDRELKQSDYDGKQLSDAKMNDLIKSFNAVGMSFLTKPGDKGKTFVLDPKQLVLGEKKKELQTLYSGNKYNVYNLTLFKAGDKKIPTSTVNVPAPLNMDGGCTGAGDAERRPLVKGTAELAGRSAAVEKGILLDTGAPYTDITSAFAQKLTGAKNPPAQNSEMTLDALTLGQGKDAVVIKNVKVLVSDAYNPDKREMCVGQNILGKFVTVWKLADEKPTVGFSLPKGKDAPDLPGAPATPYRDIQFITPGQPTVQARNEYQAGFEDLVSSGLSQPTYLVLGSHGDIFVSDKGQNSVLELGQDGTLVRAFSDPDLEDPEGVAIDPNGNLFVSSAAKDLVMIFDATGSKLNEISSEQLKEPKGLAFGPAGELFVASFGTNSIVEFDPVTRDLLNSFADAGLAGPEGLAFTDDGFLFVAGSTSNNIMLLDALASQPSLTLFPTTAPLNGPAGVFVYSNATKEDHQRGPSSYYGLQRLLIANHLDQQILTIGGKGDLLDEAPTSGQPVGVTATFQLVLCDVNHDGKIDSADIALIQAALGQKVASGDVRDPDDDGVITSNDVQICESFCDQGSACSAP